MSKQLRATAAACLVYLAKRVTMGKRTVPLNDLEYGLHYADLAISNPMGCRCMSCVMGREQCDYEREIGFKEQPELWPEEVSIVG